MKISNANGIIKIPRSSYQIPCSRSWIFQILFYLLLLEVNWALLAWRYPKLKNKWPQNSYIFLIPLNIPDFAASIVFLICVRLPGGAAIIFSQSWNFELKFFVDNPYVKKIGTRSFWIHFLSKNKFKTAIFEIWKFSDYIWKSWKWP